MSQGSFRGRRRKSPLSFGGDIEPPIATNSHETKSRTEVLTPPRRNRVYSNLVWWSGPRTKSVWNCVNILWGFKRKTSKSNIFCQLPATSSNIGTVWCCRASRFLIGRAGTVGRAGCLHDLELRTDQSSRTNAAHWSHMARLAPSGCYWKKNCKRHGWRAAGPLLVSKQHHPVQLILPFLLTPFNSYISLFLCTPDPESVRQMKINCIARHMNPHNLFHWTAYDRNCKRSDKTNRALRVTVIVHRLRKTTLCMFKENPAHFSRLTCDHCYFMHFHAISAVSPQ
jgi:hypothetical protein